MDELERAEPAPRLLDRYSEDELENRIKALRDEIAACEAELERKRAHRSAADAVFKTD